MRVGAAVALPVAAPEAGAAAAREPGVAGGGADVADWLAGGDGLLDPEALDAVPAAGDGTGDAEAVLTGGAEAAAGAAADWLTALVGAWLDAPGDAGGGAAAVEGAGAGGADTAGAVPGNGAPDLFADVAALSVERAALSAERAALSAERAGGSGAGAGLA